MAFLSLTRALVLAGGLAMAAGAAAQNSVVIIPGIKVGVVSGERAATTAARLEPFRRRLAEAVGTPVEIVTVKDGLTLVDAATTGRVDYAVFSASAYATAWRVCGCIEPLAAPRSLDGTAAFLSVLVVRAGSGIETVQDLKGKSLAAADARSVAGRLFPFAELAGAGIDPATHFGRIETVKGPDAAVRLMLAGKVDAAVAWTTLDGDAATGYGRGTFKDLVDRKALAMADVRIVWQSSPIPHGPHAVRTTLPAMMKTRLRDVLVNLKADDPEAYDAVEQDFGGGFVTVGHRTYEPLMVLVSPKAKPPAAAPPPG